MLFDHYYLLQNEVDVRLVGSHIPGANLLGLIVWSLIFGIFAANSGEEARVFLEVLDEVNQAFKVLFSWTMW